MSKKDMDKKLMQSMVDYIIYCREERNMSLSDIVKSMDDIFNKVKKVTDKAENSLCCICGEEIDGYGNNALPLFDGRCCDVCNLKVISARMGA